MRAAVLAFACLAGACATRDRDGSAGDRRPDGPGSQAPRAKESRVFQIQTTSDLALLDSEYQRLWASGWDGTLEVSVGAGPIQPSGWSLTPENPAGQPRIDVVVRGSGGVLPMPGRVRARSLRLENLVLTGARSGPTEIRIATAMALDRVMLVDGRVNDPNLRGGYLEVFADGGARAGARVTIERSWFVRNHQSESPMALLSLLQRGPDAGFFESVTVSRSAFLANAFEADLSVENARAVAVEGSLFYRSWPAGTELRCVRCAAAEVKGTVLVLEKPDQVAEVEGGPAVVMTDATVRPRADSGGAAEIDSAVAELVTAPLRVPAADLLDRLVAAARR